ncbi:MAG: hypothetical protein C0507_01045 [Cyanobacteria bacterium PR.3.49]|nr:hypothetical protein [Cyanobacteria bacterium PR.3.49]
MRKRTRHSTDHSIDLATTNSCNRGLQTPQDSNFDVPPAESQESQPVCKKGTCEVDWKPGRRTHA